MNFYFYSIYYLKFSVKTVKTFILLKPSAKNLEPSAHKLLFLNNKDKTLRILLNKFKQNQFITVQKYLFSLSLSFF